MKTPNTASALREGLVWVWKKQRNAASVIRRVASQRTLLTRGGTAPTTIEAHQRQVEKISHRVRGFYERGEKFRISHGSTNSTRKSATGRDPSTVVDTSGLDHVVSVDAGRRRAWVEPNVAMDRLVEETLKHGLVPPVVTEFPGITVGGAYAGTAGESSSFKHGFFDRTLTQVEMVLATGDVVTASDARHADLFRGAAGAVGTLGVTTMVEMQLVPAHEYVEATYHPVTSVAHAVATLRDFTSRPADFDYIDGIMYSPTSGAVVTGRMTASPADHAPVRRFSGANDPWFYLHVQDRIARKAGATSDAIPLPDYLFRYDRGAFWLGRAPFDYFHVPFTARTRAWLDDFLHTRMLYRALHASARSEQLIVQDLALPFDAAAECVRRMDALTGIWPLWLCPLRQSPAPTMHPHCAAYEADGRTLQPLLNIGLWGRGPRGHDAFVHANRRIEATLRDLGGMKWLYAQTYAPEHDFWRDFDRPWYDALRARYHATRLPSVWEKVYVDVAAERAARAAAGLRERCRHLWPLPGLRGLRASIHSRDYLHAREAAWKDWVPRTDDERSSS